MKLLLVFALLLPLCTSTEDSRDVLVITVATESTDGYKRFTRSLLVNNLEVTTLGMGEEWQGGDMNYAGGGWKVILLKQELEKLKDKKDLIVIFTDSYDVVFTAGKEAILAQYDKMRGGIIFGAEQFCWPDNSLRSKYPEVANGYRFLNSGGFIGSAKDIYKMLVSEKDISATDDDQLFYTKIFLNTEIRDKLDMKLDNKATIFQNLNGEADNIELKFAGNQPFVQNILYNSMPMIIHGNGISKTLLNTLGSYVPQAWNSEDQCTDCWRDTIELKQFVEMPNILLAIYIEKPTPFLEEFFKKIEDISYDKSSIDLFIHNGVKHHEKEVKKFVEKFDDKTNGYHSVEFVDHTIDIKEWHVKNSAVEKCVRLKCDYLFVLESEAHIDNPHTLKLLIEQNRDIVAPMLFRPYSAWSNFWGALSSDGYYARSMDYMDIVKNDRRGLWNVPYIGASYLISGSLIHNTKTRPSYVNKLLDPDMAFAANNRDKGIFMFVSNRINFGHLVNNEEYSTEHGSNELWEMERNRYDWELRYLHPNYSKSFENTSDIEMPCPDVYWFPIFTERFCDEFVMEAETFGEWSDGSHNDNRLQGGYEAVPTRDIHMNQIGYEAQWLYILDFYVRPLQETVFVGYFHQPPKSIMNFIVKYSPDEQPFLRPHHDSSTYTINVALNHAGVDFEGGGCHFIRYNCSVKDTKKGHMLMHPGRLTHYHEGLYVTKGTRYIMISFVDP